MAEQGKTSALRLFVAIELNEPIKAAMEAVRRRLAEFDRMVRWTRPEQMHLTLKFLGPCEDDRVAEIHEACDQVAKASRALELKLSDCGCFPPGGRVRVVWVGLDDRAGDLAACGDCCESRFADLGFSRESRGFSPHLTLGRVHDDRSDGRLRAASADVVVRPEHQTAAGLVLMRSELSPAGARYSVMGRFRFGSDG
ncbi:MAG: RNA 2',3'-cyclic phosphodiesterase [Planctomycetes bacterium]|nr:RNA 2',3'-cyclic phosphodiesterase [Planctomycetota bacterium]